MNKLETIISQTWSSERSVPFTIGSGELFADVELWTLQARRKDCECSQVSWFRALKHFVRNSYVSASLSWSLKSESAFR